MSKYPIFEYLVVGGGLFGCHVSAKLLSVKKIPPSQLGILDPNERLLTHWRQYSSSIGMAHLRSTSVHHLHPDPVDLRRFAAQQKRENLESSSPLFYPPYYKPSLSLFNLHSEKVLSEFHLPECHLRHHVEKIEREGELYTVKTREGISFKSRRVILATGFERELNLPPFASKEILSEDGSPMVQHIFSAQERTLPKREERVAVVGGGISAGHLALSLLRRGAHVTWISRHPLRENQYDADPGWIGPKNMSRFAPLTSEERREKIEKSRQLGTLPTTLFNEVQKEIKGGNLHFYTTEVERVSEGTLWTTEGREIPVKSVLLATGFKRGAYHDFGLDLSEVIEPSSLSPFGVVPSKTLEIAKNLFVMGRLAELEIGPMARNIVGARRAADRISRA